MGVFVVILLVGVAASNPAPQLGDLFSSFTDALSGDDEPGEVNGDYKAVPYTTIQRFEVKLIVKMVPKCYGNLK